MKYWNGPLLQPGTTLLVNIRKIWVAGWDSILPERGRPGLLLQLSVTCFKTESLKPADLLLLIFVTFDDYVLPITAKISAYEHFEISF